MPLRHRLMNGDTVEVITSPAQYPRKDWLEFVVSGRARSRIRHSIRASERERSRELGREILDRELRKHGMSLARLLEKKELAELATKEIHGSIDVLFGALGYGRINAVDIVRKLRGEQSPDPNRSVNRPSCEVCSGARPSRLRRASASAVTPMCSCALGAVARRCPAMKSLASLREVGE